MEARPGIFFLRGKICGVCRDHCSVGRLARYPTPPHSLRSYNSSAKLDNLRICIFSESGEARFEIRLKGDLTSVLELLEESPVPGAKSSPRSVRLQVVVNGLSRTRPFTVKYREKKRRSRASLAR